MNARIAVLTVLVGATLLLGYKAHRVGERWDETRAEITGLLQERDRDIQTLAARMLRTQILQTHLEECFEYHEDTLNHVDRDPCRFICTTIDLELWTDELDETICGDLP